VRVLFYPLIGLVVVVAAAMLIAGLIAGINGWRAKRAKQNARWEPFADVKDGGDVEFGVRLVARWGNHEKELQRDTETERVSVDDLIARYDALARAQARALSINEIRLDLTRGRQ
jgi:hypothetical protein